MNIYYLDQAAYQQDCKKKLHELWPAKYMTETKARDIRTVSHLDLMLIRKIVDYKHDQKTNMKVPVYQSPLSCYWMLLNLLRIKEEEILIRYSVLNVKSISVLEQEKVQKLSSFFTMKTMNVLKGQ